ncbi:hypothetical protein Tco_0427971 [Tanacetum coccineum]
MIELNIWGELDKCKRGVLGSLYRAHKKEILRKIPSGEISYRHRDTGGGARDVTGAECGSGIGVSARLDDSEVGDSTTIGTGGGRFEGVLMTWGHGGGCGRDTISTRSLTETRRRAAVYERAIVETNIAERI